MYELMKALLKYINKKSEENAKSITSNLELLKEVNEIAKQASSDAKKANDDLNTFLNSTESDDVVNTVREIIDLVDKNDTDILSQVANLAAEVDSAKKDMEEAKSYVQGKIDELN